MQLLLDTHALLWWLVGSDRLSATARTAVGDSTNTVFVSAVSSWEVATKFRLGKLPSAAVVAQDLHRHVARQGFAELPVSFAHGQRAGSLPGLHRDPFDRMLIAQAQANDLALVSNEALFDAYGVRRVW